MIGRVAKAMAHAVRGICKAVADPATKGPIGLTAAIVVLASTFYTAEGWSLLDAMFFSVATISTAGYGDLVPVTAAGRIFTIGDIFVGIGVFVATADAIARQVIRQGHDPERMGPEDAQP
jgi:voltage-gated potassium channel Kch